MTEAARTTLMCGEVVEIPAGMSEEDYWVMVNNSIKDQQYDRLTQSTAAIHHYVRAEEQGAHPVESETALSYDREHVTPMRGVRE